MGNSAPLTEVEIREFAEAWYRKLDIHEPLENYRLLMTSDVQMVFPEATVTGFEGFTGWYERVITIFFDEVHTVKETKISSINGDKAEVKVVVRWEASIWKPPAANSERIVLDAYQTWDVVRAQETGKPAISKYVVDSLDYAPGSATL